MNQQEEEKEGYLSVTLNLFPAKETNRDPATKELDSVKIDNLENLNQLVREQFEIQEQEKFIVLFVDQSNEELELSSEAWEQVKLIGKTVQI